MARAPLAFTFRALPPRSPTQTPPKRIPGNGTKCAPLFTTTRNFFSLPPHASLLRPPEQTLTAARILPLKQADLFDIVADVDSYSAFVPYCRASRVTHWSPADHNGRRWPTLADLNVGWGGFEEKYTSRLCCVPERGIVEAISGEASSDLPEARQSGGGDGEPGYGSADGSVFRSLVTRWTLRPARDASGSVATEARLTIRFQFNNPIYAAASVAVSDKISIVMIEAFEKRARGLLG